jgi:hypothetical protein
MIIAVEQYNLGLESFQSFGNFQASKASANYNDPGFTQISNTRSRGN